MPQYRRAPLYEIIFRLLVYAACAGFCLVGWLLLLCALDAVGNASGMLQQADAGGADAD